MTRTDRIRGVDLALPVVALWVGVGIWWVLTGPVGVAGYLLPSPTAVGTRLVSSPELYLGSSLHTLWKVLVGGSVGATTGFALALAVYYQPFLRRSIYPYLVTVRVLPTIALAPLLLIYVGVGTTAAVVFVSLLVFFPMVVNTVAGFERAPERELDLLRSVSADGFRASLSVRLPYALPDVFSGLKQGVTLSVVGAVVAEWLVADRGLGYLVLVGSENVQTDSMVAALVVLVVIGVTLYGGVVLLQRQVPWIDEL